MEEQTKNENMSMGNKIFYIVLALLIVGSVGITFYRIVVQKDYQIVAQVSCNPILEKCFVYKCDPTTEECSENLVENISYYKNISKKAATIYNCEKTDEKIGCSEELGCTEGEVDCSYTYCDSAQLLEGETCSE